MADEKRYQLATDIRVVKDKHEDPVGKLHKAGKRFTAAALRRAGVDDGTRDHWIDKGVIRDLAAEEGDDDGGA